MSIVEARLRRSHPDDRVKSGVFRAFLYFSLLVGFASLALPALAATIGGVLGAREQRDVIDQV